MAAAAKNRSAQEPNFTAFVDRELALSHLQVRVQSECFIFEVLDDLDQVQAQLLQGSHLGQGHPGDAWEACPHFGVIWPSAIALTSYLIDCGAEAIDGKSVLELGCGLGLPSMLSGRLGAKRVVASDKHPLVPVFLARNALRNHVSVEYLNLDWRQCGAKQSKLFGRFDFVIGSDLLYEPWQPGFLAGILPSLLKSGGEALIADPGRKFVDQFVVLTEAQGYKVELADLRLVNHGNENRDVLILRLRI